MPGAIEGHVLEEVGQAVLIVLFQDGSHILSNVKLGPFFGLLIVANVIGKPIIEFSVADSWIQGQGLVSGLSEKG